MSTVGIFRALGTQSGNWGFQGSILGPNTGRKLLFDTIWDVFLTLLGSVFEVLFGKTSGSRF